MLVKELRQGMRARGFIMLFLSFQFILGFLLLTVGANVSDDAGGVASTMIFSLFGFAALMIQPLRGVNALSSEISGNTIEMMALTRLTASRIVLGKWVAIVSQSALILITIIPYLILRYFLGGMIVTGELVLLALIFLSSMALTAVTVGLSGTTTKLVRVLPTVFFIFLLMAVPNYLFRSGGSQFISFCAMNDWPSRLAILAYVSSITYLGWCALSCGISAIAPVAENHSTLRRLIAIALTVIAVAIGLHPDTPHEVSTIILIVILTPAIIVAVTEPARLVPPLCKPFLKRGPLGKLAGIFLLPGWPTGVFFSGLLILTAAAGIYASLDSTLDAKSYVEMHIVSLAYLGGIMLPALLSTNFTKQDDKRFATFMAFLIASVILTFVPGMIFDADRSRDLLWLFIWNPPTFLVMVANSSFNDSALLKAVVTVDLVLGALLLITALRGHRLYSRVFRETEEEFAETAAAKLQ